MSLSLCENSPGDLRLPPHGGIVQMDHQAEYENSVDSDSSEECSSLNSSLSRENEFQGGLTLSSVFPLSGLPHTRAPISAETTLPCLCKTTSSSPPLPRLDTFQEIIKSATGEQCSSSPSSAPSATTMFITRSESVDYLLFLDKDAINDCLA